MNKKLLALSLVAAPGLMAQEASEMNTTHEQTGYCNTCCCTPCCCCVPKPKKCIDCECYTPAFYDLQCDCGFFADVAFLYWYARETNLSYALKAQVVPRTDDANVVPGTLVFAPRTYENLKTDWEPGVRAGIGWNSECDGWDYYLSWTYYHNKQTNSTSVADFAFGDNHVIPDSGEFFLLNPWINASFHGINPSEQILLFDKVNAKWRFTLNIIDLEIGRKYWLSRCFNLRPYAGLRGAWTRDKFRTKSTRNFETTTPETVDISFTDRFKTKNWGVGLLGGLQPTWYFCDNFALYSNAEMALIWGDFDIKKKEKYIRTRANTTTVTDPNYNNHSKNKFAQMNALLDLAIGLRWEEYWCCDQYRTALDLGWEHHIWFDHNHRNKTSDFTSIPTGSSITFSNINGFRQFDEATGNLCYGGFVLRLRFEF